VNKVDHYHARINRVSNHIATHLDQTHTLEELAEVAALSKFHFHRLFSAITGETVQRHVTRLRLERAAATLIYKQERTITNLALDHGFSSGANFSKAFSKHFGVSPSDYRNENSRLDKNSKIGKANHGIHSNTNVIETEVTIVEVPTTHLAYVRGTGQMDSMDYRCMHKQVWAWVSENNCLTESQPLSLGITWSDSHIVDEEQWVYDACVAVKPETKGNGKIGIQTMPKGLVAQCECNLDNSKHLNLSPYWDWFVGNWFVGSGYDLRSSPSYEIYLQTDDRFVVRLCLPIENTLSHS